MFEACFYGALLRMAQALLQAAPFLATGLFVAGVMQQLLGRAGTRRLFGADTWRSLPQAWAIGMLLPVCSFGVIPIVREMRRSGLSGGTILAFALSAPLFNPLSLLYGLTIAEPFTILAFATCSLVLVTLVGVVWDRICPGTAIPEEPSLHANEGLKRLLSVGVVAAREMVGPTFGFLVVGLLGVGLLSLALPPTSMQHAVQHDNPWAPLVMAAVATPAYASPMTAINQVASMFQHGNSVGAAFTLLTLGAGMNVGLILWMTCTYGVRKSLLWFGLLGVVVVGLSYGIERPLYPDGIEAADHTHAFDGYCRPFLATSNQIPNKVWIALKQDTPSHEWIGLAVVGLLMVVGGVLRVADPRGRLEAWLLRADVDRDARAWYERRVSTATVGFLALLTVVALSAVGCYTYYPRAREAFKEIEIANAETLGSAIVGERTHAARWLTIYEDWIRKLQVGIYLRGGRLSKFQRLKAELLLDRLESLEHELAHDDRIAIRKLCTAIERSRSRLLTATEESFPQQCR
jgi:uncharacterized membrane protein YraQ (UPF0718 family)